MPAPAEALPLATRPDVRCTSCGKTVFDGLVIKSRVVRVLPRGAEAKCGHCKNWTPVPVAYHP